MEYSLRRSKLPRIRSLKGKMLQLLRPDGAYVQSVSAHKEVDVFSDVSPNHGYSRHTETTLLEVEHRKVKALMEIERQRTRMF